MRYLTILCLLLAACGSDDSGNICPDGGELFSGEIETAAGARWMERCYVADQPHGRYRVFRLDADRTLAIEGYANHGEPCGTETQWYDNGEIMTQTDFAPCPDF